MNYSKGITIDGTYFDIPLVSLKRKADVLDKYAKRTENGDLQREIIGVYFNYEMSVGIIDDSDLYDALYDKLTEPEEFHTISLPASKGVYTFTGYISSVSDEYRQVTSSGATFQNLTCKLTAKVPGRR